MKKRLTACILLAALVFSLCGCGSLFEKEYLSVTDYDAPEYVAPEDDDRVTVRSFTQLRHAILQLVSSRLTTGTLVFDAAYDGDIAADMASACWQLRTQNALCAYCVENISYELTKIVTYSEADVTVSYSKEPEILDEIIDLSYAIGIDDIIRSALEDGDRRILLYIQTSNYTAEQMADTVTGVYRENPLTCGIRPSASVHMYSGTGRQRLYEINLAYGMNAEKLAEAKQLLSASVADCLGSITASGSALRAMGLCEYLAANCEYAEDAGSGAFAALVEHRADGEGLALAYVGLCKRLGISCEIVYGQCNWTEHCWNIIELDGAHYHVDVSVCAEGLENGFLLTDEQMWNTYRWDTSAYDKCDGELTVSDLLA